MTMGYVYIQEQYHFNGWSYCDVVGDKQFNIAILEPYWIDPNGDTWSCCDASDLYEYDAEWVDTEPAGYWVLDYRKEEPWEDMKEFKTREEGLKYLEQIANEYNK